MSHPVLKTIQNHFSRAKEIQCLRNGLIVAIVGIRNFEYDEKENAWTTPGGSVTVWRNGEYADIVTKKKCQCKSCDCNKKSNN